MVATVAATANQRAKLAEYSRESVSGHHRHRACVRVLCLQGIVRYEALRRAAYDLQDRHEALRVRFHTSSHGDNFLTAGSSATQFFDVFSGGTRECEEFVVSKLSHPFDPFGDGRWRLVSCFDVERRITILAIAVDHLVSDDWSLDILLSDLTALYEVHSSSGPRPGLSSTRISVTAPSLLEQTEKVNERHRNCTIADLKATDRAMREIEYDTSMRGNMGQRPNGGGANRSATLSLSPTDEMAVPPAFGFSMTPACVAAAVAGAGFRDSADIRSYLPVTGFAANRNCEAERRTVGWFAESFILPVPTGLATMNSKEDVAHIRDGWQSSELQAMYPVWLWQQHNPDKILQRTGVTIALLSFQKFNESPHVLGLPTSDYAFVYRKQADRGGPGAIGRVLVTLESLPEEDRVTVRWEDCVVEESRIIRMMDVFTDVYSDLMPEPKGFVVWS